MKIATLNWIVLQCALALAVAVIATSAAGDVDIAAKQMKQQIVDSYEMNGIKIDKVKKRDCALQDCEEITAKCGWCALSSVNSTHGYGLKYEKEEEKFLRACPGAEVSVYGLIKLCNATRAIITVNEDCPGQYTFFKADCPKNGLKLFVPTVIHGTPENAPLILPFLEESG